MPMGASPAAPCCFSRSPAWSFFLRRPRLRWPRGAYRRQLGFTAELLTPEEAAKLIPGLRRDIKGALYSPKSGHINPIVTIKLFQRAARLSRIELEQPKEVIGRNTVAALRSGWVYGYVGLVEGLVHRIKAQLGEDALVIATGGLADYVLAETNVADVHDPTLTLKGLRLYYERNITCPSP